MEAAMKALLTILFLAVGVASAQAQTSTELFDALEVTLGLEHVDDVDEGLLMRAFCNVDRNPIWCRHDLQLVVDLQQIMTNALADARKATAAAADDAARKLQLFVKALGTYKQERDKLQRRPLFPPFVGLHEAPPGFFEELTAKDARDSEAWKHAP
jgi:hypothetical protein